MAFLYRPPVFKQHVLPLADPESAAPTSVIAARVVECWSKLRENLATIDRNLRGAAEAATTEPEPRAAFASVAAVARDSLEFVVHVLDEQIAEFPAELAEMRRWPESLREDAMALQSAVRNAIEEQGSSRF